MHKPPHLEFLRLATQAQEIQPSPARGEGYLLSLLLCLACLFCLAAPAFAAPVYETFTLKNGMEVVVVNNPRLPIVSHMLWFKIGAADDPPGKSGLAHYVEHMMFQGTPTVPAGEYAKKIAGLGGVQNAFTSHDYTAFYVNIAKEHLPDVMTLEADRMQHLSPPPDDFKREREVIIEERRARTDNQPEAQLREQMSAALFLNHPYGIPVIGWLHEMRGLAWADIKPFHDMFYQPNNAILVVAGDVTAAEIKPLAEKYYGPIPPTILPPRVWKAEPPAIAARRVILRHANVRQPVLMRDYIAPSLNDGDGAQVMPLYVLAQMLGGGETSALYQSLVVKQKLAVRVGADYDGIARGPAEFSLHAVPADGVSVSQLEAAMDAEIKKFLAAPPAEGDITRAKTRLKSEVIYARDGVQNMASIFGMLRATNAPASLFETWPAQIDAVTAAQVQAAGRAVLTPEHSVTGWLEGE